MRGPSHLLRRLVPVLLVLVLLPTLPLATAQQPGAPQYRVEIETQYEATPVTPVTEVRTVQFEVKVRCSSVGVEPGFTPHRIAFSIRPDQVWATAALSRSTDQVELDPKQCLDGAETRHVLDAEIRFSQDAPAYHVVRFWFEARLDTGESADAAFTLMPGFYERWQARFDRTILQAGPDEIVRVPLTIENHGNGAIQVRFQLHEQSSQALTVVLPPPQIVPSLIAGGETSRITVDVEVRMPSETGRQDQLLIIAEGHSAEDTTKRVAPLMQALLLQTGDVGDGPPDVGELPGAGALLLPLLAVLVALAARRRSTGPRDR